MPTEFILWIIGVIFFAGVFYAQSRATRKDLNGLGQKFRALERTVVAKEQIDRMTRTIECLRRQLLALLLERVEETHDKPDLHAKYVALMRKAIADESIVEDHS